MWRFLVIGLFWSHSLALDAGAVAITPTVIDAGGAAAASDDYLQFAAGFGEAVVATAVEAQSYSGRDAYVGQLPEPATVSLVQTRYTVVRGDPPLRVPVTRIGDEDDPTTIHFSLAASLAPPSAGLTPSLGTVDLTGSLGADLTLTIGDGRPANALLTLHDPSGEVLIGPLAQALITVLPAPDLPTTMPLITSVPTLFAAQGETWIYDVVVDPSALVLPHALRPLVDLDFILIDAPAGVTVVRTGTLTARITWATVAGVDEHRLVRLRVHDRISGHSDIQEILLHVRDRPTGGG